MPNKDLSWKEFERVEMRVGTIIAADVFPEARNPSYRLRIDFGPEIGELKSSAQITERYEPRGLIGRQVVAVVNFPAKQIANMLSECLVLGAMEGKLITLLAPDSPVANGSRIG